MLHGEQHTPTNRPSLGPGLLTVASIAVAIGLQPMPYGYYMLVRLLFCGICVYYVARMPGVANVEKWLLGGLAVLYNPLVPVALGSKPLWTIINVGTLIYLWRLNRRTSGPHTQSVHDRPRIAPRPKAESIEKPRPRTPEEMAADIAAYRQRHGESQLRAKSGGDHLSPDGAPKSGRSSVSSAHLLPTTDAIVDDDDPNLLVLILAELGEMDHALVSRVLVRPGDKISVREAVLEIRTNNGTLNVPSSLYGRVTDVKVKPGDKLNVGQAILTTERFEVLPDPIYQDEHGNVAVRVPLRDELLVMSLDIPAEQFERQLYEPVVHPTLGFVYRNRVIRVLDQNPYEVTDDLILRVKAAVLTLEEDLGIRKSDERSTTEDDSDPKPEPDLKFEDGGSGYSPAHFQAFLAWDRREIAREIVAAKMRKLGTASPDPDLMPEPTERFPDGTMFYSLEQQEKLWAWNRREAVREIQGHLRSDGNHGPIPEADAKYSDGSVGYSEEQLRKLLVWNRREAIRGIEFAPASTQRRGLDNVAGMHDLKELLRRDVVEVVRNPDLYRRYKVAAPNGILLYGPPGCGKTYIARQLAEELRYYFVEIIPSEVVSKWVHDTVGKIRQLFDKAAEEAPAIIFIDEFEALVPSRSDLGGHQQYKAEEVTEFLTHLHNCSEKNIFVIAATNRPEMIDPAVRRTGRLDKLIYVGPPDLEARKEMLELHLLGRPVAASLAISSIAEDLERYSASDIRAVVDDAARLALQNRQDITEELLRAAMAKIPPSVTADLEAQYQSIEQRGW